MCRFHRLGLCIWIVASTLLRVKASISTTSTSEGLPATIAYAAFGDSYAAGVGAGRFILRTQDGKDNPCARMDGSYPWQLFTKHVGQRISSLEFLACTGHDLDQIDGQVRRITPDSLHAATLSISGNDFYFSDVVKACVYAYSGFEGEDKMQEYCQTQLDLASAAIANDTIWDKYREKVHLVQHRLTRDGWLYITGYARFWSDDASFDDECSRETFFEYPEGLLGPLRLLWPIRAAMNTLVDRVNSNIQRLVVDALGGETERIRFIDIESAFDRHRFCEPGQEPYSNHTNFYSFYSELEETGTWQGPINPDSANVPDGSNLTNALSTSSDVRANLRWLWDPYRRFATFHPKKAAHKITAKKVAYHIIRDIFPSRAAIGPAKICVSFGTGSNFETCLDVPEKCAALHPTNNSTLEIVCQDGTSLILRPN